jgi:hypothetical protein
MDETNTAVVARPWTGRPSIPETFEINEKPQRNRLQGAGAVHHVAFMA